MNWLLTHGEAFEALAHLVVLIGVPVGLLQFALKTRKERRDREYGTYNALDEHYLDFQKMCLQYPNLDVFDIPDATPLELSSEDQKRELVAFTLLFSIFERAFLMYKDQSRTMRLRQWTGWHQYIESYCGRENFRQAWRTSGRTFDVDFQAYMAGLVDDHN